MCIRDRYYNAFQPGSMMDVRSRSIADPDSRVVDRIYNLDKNEIGFQKIISVKNGSNNLTFIQEGTILEILLNKPIKTGKKLNLSIDCKSQIPIQIRRTGRYNKEDVAYSMTQWYPKMCEYDLEGWHTNPYIGREFYGVWGEFNIEINIDSSFVLGGTGILQNPNEIGHGYETKKIVRKGNTNKLKWHFKAENVHDFAWAADPFFIHEQTFLNNGTILHFLHKNDSLNNSWKRLQPYAVKCFEYMNENYGEYFDESGRTLRKAFLKAPLDFYRISSRYSRNRKHPVTGQWKGHFGTDYAAPKGTPIMTTANGTIVTASFTRNNGNYVKVRHNGTYSTQYLHMSKIKRGIKKGVYVKQGDIIGYVGSTGLATGPHVCYRFWKNGKQVDPYKQKLPPGDPIRKENKSEYMFVKDSLMNILNRNI